MKIIQSDNLLNDPYFQFDRSANQLSDEQRTEIKKVSGTSFLFEQKSEFEYKSFVRYFNYEFLENKNIYFVFSESFSDTKNRIRSYQKLFYKENKKIGEENLYEKEIELENGQSIIVGIVKLSEDNFNYCVEKLFTSDFVFGYAVDKELILDLLNGALLDKIVHEFFTIEKRRMLNPLKLSLGLCEKKSFVFRLLTHGNNAQSLDIFSLKEQEKEIWEIGEKFIAANETVSFN